MGGGQSARKLTIENEEDIDVIKVSQAVVERINEKVNEGNSEPVNEVKPTDVTHSPTNTVVSSRLPHDRNIPSSSEYPTYYYPQLTLTALQMQQQKEQELKNQNQYWKNRLKSMEKRYSEMTNILDHEYKKAAAKLHSVDQKNMNIEDEVQPCFESNVKILKCYQEHPNEILMCSKLVEEFSNCVDQCRTHVISSRC
ncbi:MICOS complex subunit MIC19-like [Hylaeus volcanicus]|uniref:MICOS complex subunit MIC19-like n=1 Tax=Hylaeus volcanicus TaxID=313075 RepID=UPI0023B863EF|nr:MICOS complex subunit MIC19-like [Hylaeus volcanicus]